MSSPDIFSSMVKYISEKNIPDEDIKKFAKILFNNAYQNYDYIKCVLYPDIAAPCRFPSQFPMPTSIHKQKDSFYVQMNPSGNAFIQYSPNAKFTNDTGYNQDVVAMVWNGPTLNTASSVLLNSSVTDAQVIASGSYDWIGPIGDTVGQHRIRFTSNNSFALASAQYRVVAASITITYIGTDDSHSGLILAATVPDVDSYNMYNTNVQDTEDAAFSHIAKPKDGVRHICIPTDITQTGFLDVSTVNTNMTCVNIWALGLPTTTTCLRCEITRIIELIPTPIYKEIVPTTTNTSSINGIEIVSDIVNESPLYVGSTLKETIKMPTPKESFAKKESSILSTIASVWNNPIVNTLAEVGASLIPGGSIGKSVLDTLL